MLHAAQQGSCTSLRTNIIAMFFLRQLCCNTSPDACLLTVGAGLPMYHCVARSFSRTRLYCTCALHQCYVACVLSLPMLSCMSAQPTNAVSWCSAVKAAEDVDACIEAVEATVNMSGWPSIPQPVLQVGSLPLLPERACCLLHMLDHLRQADLMFNMQSIEWLKRWSESNHEHLCCN